MSDFAFDREMPDAGPSPRRRNANLGTSDAEEIFMAFDTRIMRRFFGFLSGRIHGRWLAPWWPWFFRRSPSSSCR